MDTVSERTPFHAGERAAQKRAGAGDVAQWASGFIRDYLPQQHRDFHTSLPFLVVSGAGADGHTWVTLLDGPDGFIRSPNPRALTLNTEIDAQDPLRAAVDAGTDIGAVGIELHSRRRNRFSGRLKRSGAAYTLDIKQTFGNCPQYIHERSLRRVSANTPAPAKRTEALTPSQTAWITNADTLFIGSGHQYGADVPSRGFDASHRGGLPGFVRVSDATHLHIPDYAGNNFFNTIGNLLADPRVGLVFVDFDSGSLLHISGRASINWHPDAKLDPEAHRVIDVTIDAVIERPNALGLRWSKPDADLRQFTVSKRVKESEETTSFYLSPVDGEGVTPYAAGQHLPIEINVPGHTGPVKRSYSLSGDPSDKSAYRLTIKRESHGLASRHLHDGLEEGAMLRASQPAGDFVIPQDSAPLVLVSAGVGLTPMVSMLHTLAQDKAARPVWFVHGAKDSAHHALRSETDALVEAHDHLHQRLFYSRPSAADQAAGRFDHHGRITAQALLQLEAGATAHYLLCGPARFIAELRSGLEAAGVPAEQIHFESFGPSAR
ncbi:pyridoxamine 5'-phosphate oxidase family protein [Shimia sp. R9_2]|uniref:FAD-binding oxidoreductase n=1 Tax=Shimia sp. R9_2 TaxID=2821112 RepID=UPI001ADD0CA2|nr:pyridoxamine 5'-phosphate oxidase family protein [Shimia sp. R9_2]MBO9398572.1 pyridoxamine 5'-phosphate oxidase family protein [Shimia sp. R9_2]